MSETKHTPGPWVLSHGGLPGDDGFSIATNNAAAANVKIVCECWPCTITGRQHREELAANARLIAAAPELLEACEFALDEITVLVPGRAANPAIKILEAAIAKAKGGVE